MMTTVIFNCFIIYFSKLFSYLNVKIIVSNLSSIQATIIFSPRITKIKQLIIITI